MNLAENTRICVIYSIQRRTIRIGHYFSGVYDIFRAVDDELFMIVPGPGEFDVGLKLLQFFGDRSRGILSAGRLLNRRDYRLRMDAIFISSCAAFLLSSTLQFITAFHFNTVSFKVGIMEIVTTRIVELEMFLHRPNLSRNK